MRFSPAEMWGFIYAFSAIVSTFNGLTKFYNENLLYIFIIAATTRST